MNDSLGAVLEVGQVASVPGAPAGLMPHRFNRHTFWCGQSGSGKTYSLGVLLEELLMHTELPMIIFDPNADFVRLAEVRDDAPPARAAAVTRRDLRILRPGQAGESPRVRFTALGLSAKAAVLRLDPLIDRVEYNTLLHLEDVLSTREIGRVLPELRASNDPALIDFALRMENLGILSWDIWAQDKLAATEIIDTRPAATVLDLGGFKSKEEPLVVALSVLDDLWSRAASVARSFSSSTRLIICVLPRLRLPWSGRSWSALFRLPLKGENTASGCCSRHSARPGCIKGSSLSAITWR